MDDNRLDAAIDDVAREMTAGEPHGAFRAQVLADIERFVVRGSWFGGRRSWFVVRGSRFVVRGSWFGARGVVTAAAVAAVLAVVLFQFRRPHATSPPYAAVAPAPSVADRRVESEPAMTNPNDSALKASGTTTSRDDRRRIVTIVQSEVDALAPPPLDIDSIAVAALPAPSSIRLDEMEPVAPIAIAPLSVDDQGERR